MPRYSLPKLNSISKGSFEPNRKNPISLRDDENLDDNFKPLKIGDSVAPLELSEGETRISGNLLVQKLVGDINIADGDVNLSEGGKIRFDNDISSEAYEGLGMPGNSYINVESDVMYFYVGGEKLLTIGQNFGIGSSDKITTFTSHLSIDEGQKLYFEGMDSDSYLIRTTSDDLEYWGDGTKLFSMSDGGTFSVSTVVSASTGSFTTLSGSPSFSGSAVTLEPEARLIFDGGNISTARTYISESAADTLDFHVNSVAPALPILRLTEDSVSIVAESKLIFNPSYNVTWITESSRDVLDIVVGNDMIFQITESGADGNTIDIDNACIGFTQLEPTYDATDTLVDFRLSNKHFLTFGSGNITNLQLRFPLVSGNFVLLVKQDGTGSRTITNYKAQEFDESAADGSTSVKFAGGSNPTLTTDANHVDIISFYWDADNEIAYGVATLDFQF